MTKPRQGPPTLAEVTASGTPDLDKWELRLYVAGKTPKSVAAIANLQRLKNFIVINQSFVFAIEDDFKS